MKKSKIKLSTVQTAFNKAICLRDKVCRVHDGTPCKGVLQCSHFYPVGGNSGLRFYPFNAFGQCAGHHLSHHNRDPLMYARWMESHYPEELKWMEAVRGIPVRYSQQVLAEILDTCREGNLALVRTIIRRLYGECSIHNDL